MKKFLYITKNFPPEIGGGIRRIEAVYRILLDNKNIDLDVITSVPEAEKEYEKVKYIKQIFFKDKKAGQGISFKKSRTNLKLIDKALLGWVPNVLKCLIKKKYDYIFVSCPSFSNIIAGYLYKKLVNRKAVLIIEYRDFFSFNPSYENNTRKKIANLLEKIIIKYSDFIITTTLSMKKILSCFKDENKIMLVRNFMRKQEAEFVEKINIKTFDNDFFNVGYVGKLNTGRNPDKILNLLNYSHNHKKTALHFIGVNDSEKEYILDYAERMELDKNRLFFSGMVSRMKSLELMKKFEGLLLIINNNVLIKDGYGIPGKLYDYTALNNNIFSDFDSFVNLSEEFDCNIVNRFENMVNYKINSKDFLEPVFNFVINKITGN